MTIDATRRRRILGFCLVLVGCMFFGVRGYHDQKLALQSFDFKPVYSSTRCLIDGCDPYDSVQIEQEYLQHGGDGSDLRPFRPFNANYPPSALFLVIPLALLPFEVARAIWLCIGIVLFSCAALCVADLCVGRRALWAQGLLAVFVVSSTMLIMLGQPAMFAISLAVIGAWSFLRQRWLALGVVAFAVSLTFKPHDGGLIWLFFLLSAGGAAVVGSSAARGRVARGVSFRRLALYTLAAAIVLLTPGVLLAFHHPASAHWPQELHTNLVGIAAHGQASDPGPTNGEVQSIASLQAVFALVHDVPRFYNLTAYATFLPLFLAWLYLVVRRGRGVARQRVDEDGRDGVSDADLMALAAAAALSFLPIYHRQYDTRLLLLMFPAVAVLASGYRWMGRAAIVLSGVAIVAMSHQFVHLGPLLVRRGVRLPGAAWLLFFRPLPLMLLLLSCFFLYGMFVAGGKERNG
ncbi:MAG: glycosyltransferase family 87 protein [Acidobacteriaceae bacterium]